MITNQAQEISPMLVGVNVWYIDPSQEVWDLTEQCGVTSLRIGGHSYDDNMPSNDQLKDWVSRIQSMGAEPIMQVSQYDTPEAAAALVKFFNVDLATGKAIKYWNIGNEPWLQNGRPAISTVGAMVAAYFKPISVAMKVVDAGIKIYGPDFCYFIGDAIADLYGSESENDIAVKIPGKDYYYSDGISWHRYPQEDNIHLAYAGIEDFKGSIVACKARVDEVNIKYNRTGDDALGWGIGEFNAKGGSVVHTWMNGQMYGGILDLCMKYEATYATSWSMFENGGSRSGTDFSFIDGNMTPRANYRHMEMVTKYFRGNYCSGESTLSDIIVSASREEDTVSVMIMNRSKTSSAYTLHLNMDGSSGSGVVLNVDADSIFEYSDIIGGETTQLFVFKNDEIFKINYSSYHFDNDLPPDESFVLMAKIPPQAPSSLSCIDPTYKSITLQWEPGTNDTISGYFIERKEDENSEFVVIGMADNNATTYIDMEVDAASTYTYRIQAYNSAGSSTYSNESSASTPDLPAKVAFNGPHSVPGIIQAEDYNDNEEGIGYHDFDPENLGGAYRLVEGVDLQACTDEGGGYNVAYVEDGEWLEYLIEDIEDGTYDIALRVASNADNTNRIRLYLNETFLGSVTPVNTGGWQNWTTLIINEVNISGGNNQILKVALSGSAFNINWIELGTDLIDISTKDMENPLKAYYNSQANTLIIEVVNVLRTANITLYDSLGRVQLNRDEHQFKVNQYSLGLRTGIYFLCLTSEKGSQMEKIFIQ
jgi:hypothetical protein